MLTKWPEQINQNGCFCHLPYIPEHVWGEVPSTHLKAPGRSTRVEVTVWWDREDQQAVSRAWISQPDLLHGLLHRYLYWMNIHQLDLSVSLSLSLVSVSESGFSAVDQRESPRRSTNCATRPDPLEQPLNSTRSPSADRTAAPHRRRAAALPFYRVRNPSEECI